MEVNKDEAERCLEIAKKKIEEHQYESALKFVTKSRKLYPLPNQEYEKNIYFSFFTFEIKNKIK